MSDMSNTKIFDRDWALALMRNGIIVTLKISRWRGTTRLTPDVLGIKFSDGEAFDIAKRYLSLGHQKLLPPSVGREFEAIEKRSRDLLSTYSFNTVWGKFVPITAFKIWESQNEALKKEYMDLAKQFGDKFNSIIATVKSDYKFLAKDVWERLYPNGGDPTDSFIESFSNNIVDKIPDLIKIMSDFKYESVYSVIPMPSFVEKDISEARDIERERELKDHNANLQKQTEEIISSMYVERRKEIIDDFLNSTVREMRNNIAELCDEVLISLGKEKYKNRVSDSQIKKIKRMIKRVRILNFYNDEDINRRFNELEFEVDKRQCDMNRDVVTDKLEEIVSVAKKEFKVDGFVSTVDYLEV